MRRNSLNYWMAGAAVLSFAAAGWVRIASAQQQAAPPLEILKVRGNIYALIGAGGNITISVGKEDGVLLVDSGLAQNADRVLDAVNNLSRELATFDQPITRSSGAGGSGSVLTGAEPPTPHRYITNTH